MTNQGFCLLCHMWVYGEHQCRTLQIVATNTTGPVNLLSDMEAVRQELAAVKAERDRLSSQLVAACRVFGRLQSEGVKLTRLEENRISGLPDDWTPLSERYPEHFGRKDDQ